MKNGNRRATTRINSAVLIGVFFILAAVVAVPVYTTRSAAQSLKAPAGSSSVRFFTPFSNVAISPLSSLWLSPNPQAPAEMIETFASDCITPKTDFDLGETVCAKITGAPLGDDDRAARRIGWVSPYGSLAQGADITTDPQNGTYLIPTSQTQTFTDSGGGEVVADNRGTWTVNTYSTSNGSLQTSANFTVHDPATPYVDLAVGQSVSETNSTVPAGSSSTFNIIVSNRGPDAGANVVLTGAVPNDSTFVAMTQTSGPTFSCTTPLPSETGAITCTIASLAKDATATFDLAYNVNAGTPNGTIITSNATISSATAELVAEDNASTKSAKVGGVGGGGTGTCSIGCPDDITTPANTVDGNNAPGAVVHFSPPSGNDECGVIVVDHCNDCFFPVGTTVVTATGVGDSCSFTVTVTPAGTGTTISCPSNKSGTADGSCDAVFNLGTASATGTNVTVVAFRNDGKPVYTCDEFGNCTRNSSDSSFSVGTSTVTWFAYSHDIPGPYDATTGDEESHRTGSASCTQTVFVQDVTPPTIAATDTTVAADASCQGTVPDFSNTVSDNCACSASDESQDCQNHNDIAYTQTPAAGTMVGIGPHTIHIEASDGTNTATKDIILTVADQTAPAIDCPDDITTNTDPGLCSAVVNPGTPEATDNCDSSPTIVGTRSDNQPMNAPYQKGTTIITWSATDDAGNTSSCNQSVTVNDTEPPTIVCPVPTTASADASCQAAIPDRRAEATKSDNCGDVTVTQSPAPGTMVGLGTHTITLTATDSSGNTSTCQTTFTVIDTTAPTITITSQTLTMWPPNHKYQTFLMSQLVTGVSDNCSTLNTGNVVIASVSSDEPENAGGDGNTNNDIVIAADCKSIQLRAERAGSGDGRVYTINVVVKDQAGNVGAGSIKVRVPKTGPTGTAVDSGPNYTVNGTCPP